MTYRNDHQNNQQAIILRIQTHTQNAYIRTGFELMYWCAKQVVFIAVKQEIELFSLWQMAIRIFHYFPVYFCSLVSAFM